MRDARSRGILPVAGVVVGLLAGFGVGCAGDRPAVDSMTPPPPVVAASRGCGGEPPGPAGETVDLAMRVGELDRSYRVHLPPAYDPERPTAVVLHFHGYTGTVRGTERYTRLSRHADANGYVVVYPQGTGFEVDGGLVTSWNDLAGSASPGPAGPICSPTASAYPHPPECGEPVRCNWATCHDDLGFVEALLDRLEDELCVDLDRVYATGMSNGGMFAHRLGCAMPERFAAIAPVGGTLARGFKCAPRAPLAMMNVYGRHDDYVSQRGDTSSDGYYYEAATEVLALWAGAESQRCDPATTVYETGQDGVAGLACVQHDACASGAEVVHCEWDGAHDWPRAGDHAFGNDLIWEFFSRHTRSGYGGAAGAGS